MTNIALITGGNGITGSAIIEELVRSTNKDQWSRIIVTSRSPFKTTVEDPRIEFVALDFTADVQTLAKSMKETCAAVTHAYFSSYVHRDDFVQLNSANKALFENFLDALLQVAPELKNCTLQTGGKYYNVHLYPVPTPASETDARQGPPEQNFYFPQEDYLAERQQGQSWSWNVVRPEAILGYTCKPNGMNSVLTWALYFLVCKHLGEEAKMPTNQLYWSNTDDCSDAELIAQFTIWASNSANCANQAFNIVNGDHLSWRYMWPRIAGYLGAKSSSDQSFEKAAPKEGEPQQDFRLQDWSEGKRPVWDELCEKAGVSEAKATWDAATWAYQDWVFQRSWSATLSMTKARQFGWTGYKDSYESITAVFDKLKELKQIP